MRVGRWQSRVLVAGAVVVLALMPGSAQAAQFIGGDGSDTFHGTNNNDEFWTYAGNDTVHADNGADELRMGNDRDFGYGQDGRDVIFGGDNSTSSFEYMYGGSQDDELWDSTGPDQDKLCGGPGGDYHDTYDGDTQDVIKGGGGTDNWSKDSGDSADGGADC
jgi:hypothetical protein